MMVFLGNPGNQYRLSRHNYAWRLLDGFSRVPSAGWQKKFKGSFLQIPGFRSSVGILKPETFMNKSGESVGAAATFFKHAPEEVLVIHDDIELPFGAWSLKQGGGLGGHNGLKSISSSLGSRDFYRLRLGVGRPVRGDVASFVLGRFTPHEEAWLGDILSRGAVLLDKLMDKEPQDIPESLREGRLET